MTPRQWGAVIGGLVGFNMWRAFGPAKGDGCLSPAIRTAFRVHTRGGRYAFLAFLAGGVTWFAPHIVGRPGRLRRVLELVDDAHTIEEF